MNKIKILLILAVIASTVLLASAFTSTTRPVSSRSSVVWDDTLFWFQPSGGESLTYDAYLLREDEVDHSDCDDEGSIVCRKGYRSDQMVNPAIPSLGVKPGEKNNPEDIIKKINP